MKTNSRKPNTVQLVFAVLVFVAQSQAWAFQQVPSQMRFSVPVDSPSALQICGDKLWVYSAKNRNLQNINEQTGAVITRTPLASLGMDGHILALGCSGRTLLIALQKRQGLTERKFYLFKLALSPEGKLGRAQALSAPGQGLIRDIFCRDTTNYCLLIRDSIFSTSDLKNWKPLKIALAKDIPFSDTNLQANPFSNFQDSFIIASGQYFRGGFLKTAQGSTLYLLDPLRVAVARFPMNAASSSSEPEILGQKFGRWGVWEGRLMSPKGITTIQPAGATTAEAYFVISDIGLKLIFIFSQDGQYLGTTGADGGTARFKYPLNVVSRDNVVFVADFGASRVTSLVLDPQAIPPAPVKNSEHENLEDLLRKNFFRDPEVLKDSARTRCLSCHDGLEVNSLDKFMEQGKHHPINITTQATKIDLPLEQGNTVTCSTCHDAHHGIILGVTLDPGAKQNPFMLRKSMESLCSTCHPGRADPSSNHPGMNPKEGCADCHSMHISQDYLLRNPLPKLCTDCHGESKTPASHPFSPETVNCTSCHSLHHSFPKQSFATHAKYAKTKKGEPQSTCLMCHADKQALIGKNIHLGTSPQKQHQWPEDEGTCLDCHDPHGKPKPLKQLCAECHGEMKGTHSASIQAMVGTPAAKNVVLTKGKVDCMTCHDPHGASPPSEAGRSFFRPVTTFIEFCAGCHGDAANRLYEGFHNRGKK